MTARAGTLTWDIDVGRADEAQRKIDDLSRRLDAALNKPRSTGPSVFKTVSEESERASSTVQRFGDQFQKLRAQYELGHKSTSEYRRELTNLQTSLRANSHLTDENSQKFRQLATIFGQTERELSRLTREQERAEKSAEGLTRGQQRVAAADLRDRIRAMVNEVRLLRNEWQETGQNTEQTKTRMRELQGEMQTLRSELAAGEDGWEQYNREITQLAVAGRSAQATIDGMEGRMSRLGLASQVNLGATNALQNALRSLGPAGQVAGSGLGIVSSEMQKLMEIGPERVFQTIAGGMLRLTAASAALGGALAVGLSVALFKATESAAKYARELENATLRTGLTIEGQQELEHAARSTGVPLELLATTMQRLQRRAADANSGNAGLRESFDRLGVTLTDTEGKMRSTEDLLGQVADGLNRVENNADRVALAFKIFDTEGGRLLPLLERGSEGIRELREEARELGLVISGEAILSLSEFHAEVETLKQQFETARVEMAAGFLPIVRDMLVPLIQQTLVPWMQNAADSVYDFSEAFFDTTEAGEAFRRDTVKNLEAVILLGKGVVATAQAVWGAVNLILGGGAAVFGAGQGAAWWRDNSERILERRADLLEQIAYMEAQLREDWAAPGTEASVVIARNLQAAREELATLPANLGEAMRMLADEAGADMGQAATASFTAALETLEMDVAARLDELVASTDFTRPARRAGETVGDAFREGASEGTKRTIAQIEADLKEGFAQAARVASIMGDSIETELWELQEQARLTDSAIAELMRHPDVAEDPTILQGLLTRAQELNTEVAELQDRLDRLGRTPGPGGTVEEMLAAEALGPSAGMSTVYSPAALRYRLQQVRRRAEEADQAVWDAYLEGMYDPARVQAMAEAEVSGPSAGMSTGLSSSQVRGRLRAARARFGREFDAAYQVYVDAMRDPARLAEMAAAEVEGPSAGMDTGLSAGAVRARLRAARARFDAEFDAAYAAYLEQMNDEDRLQAMVDAEVLGPGAGMSTGLSPENLRARLAAARNRGLPSIEPETIEELQRQLIALRNQGVEPTDAAIRDLVRRINELQLRAALEELREKGLANLSEFAKVVLRTNGVLNQGTTEAMRFSDALRGMNDVSASGLADIIDGIRLMADSAADAETVVQGLTQALEGATALVEALGSGDAFETVKAAAMIAGEAIGQAMGVPGVGGAVGALFDLGRTIVQAISDAFTGDSPAARAIREGLTSAVQSAWTNGILQALQSGEDWQSVLRENLKLAFLTSLINAFVQSAIIGPILQPIFTEYSKMVSKGQWEAAGEYLASTLPAAINRGIQASEQFMSHLPAGLLPTPPPGPDPEPPGPTGPETTGLFELPTAAVTGIAAPDWARDLVNAGRLQLEAASSFAAAVELLRTEGISIRTESGNAMPSGGYATVARAV